MYALRVASSSGDHGPFLTLALSQQGALPMSFSLSIDERFSSKLDQFDPFIISPQMIDDNVIYIIER